MRRACAGRLCLAAMVAWISRHLVCPLHERLLSRKTFAYLRELEESQWFAPDDIKALQRRKLGALLRHAVACVPFYRERMGESVADMLAGDTDPLSVLPSLPLLDKDTINHHRNDMIWSDAPGGVHASHTGGSSGEPLHFVFDRRRQGYDQAARIRTHRWFGVDIGQREVYLWGSPIEQDRTDRVKSVRDFLFNHHLLSAFAMSPARMTTYLETLNRLNPACLFGYPSSVALLLEHARTTGFALRTASLKAVFVTGEVCYPHHREIIRDVLGAPVADCYGSREAGFIAHECPSGNLHITSENIMVEIIRDGRRVPDGESGEIVVTHLDAYAMPFVRYRTGDVGRLKPGRCVCGRGLPMMAVVEGRQTDFLHLPDGTIKHALSIIYPLREMPTVRQFRVVQDANHDVCVSIVLNRAAGRFDPQEVVRRLRAIVEDQVPVRIDIVTSIPPIESGKHRYVISHVDGAEAVAHG